MRKSLFRFEIGRMTLLVLGMALEVNPALAQDANAAGRPSLSLPIACEPKKTCFIQSYVDTDPGAAVRDYACGSATQDEHTGTDFRVLSIAAAGKDVLAAADGTVKALRDGMADALVADGDQERLKARECGNGVLIDHGQGWETQYCHLRRGSVSVKAGEKVLRGQRLGNVGYSGLAQFAHVHFEVRHNREIIDPFSGRSRNGACERDLHHAGGLWDAQAVGVFPYVNGEIIASFFTPSAPTLGSLERNDIGEIPLRTSKQLIYVVRFTNLRQGDRAHLVVSGPDGFEIESTTEPLDRNKATYMAFAGKRLTKPLWAVGNYKGHAQLLRGKAVAAEARTELQLGE